MALGTTSAKTTGGTGSDVAALVAEYNNLANAVRAITAVLDADSGVTVTTLTTGIVDAQVSVILDQNGVER